MFPLKSINFEDLYNLPRTLFCKIGKGRELL
jgi:hypothetical protein